MSSERGCSFPAHTAVSKKPMIVRYDGIPLGLNRGSGSASPSHERAFTDMRALKTPALLKNLNEALNCRLRHWTITSLDEAIAPYVAAQREVEKAGHTYELD